MSFFAILAHPRAFSDVTQPRFRPRNLKLSFMGFCLFTLSYVKYKQFDFSLLVNGEFIERKVHFPEYYKNCWESCFNSNLK